MSKNVMVMIAMSGGVDSAVSAAKLIESGYDVEGLHMTNWKDDEPYCTASQDLQDAKMPARKLEYPCIMLIFPVNTEGMFLMNHWKS